MITHEEVGVDSVEDRREEGAVEVDTVEGEGDVDTVDSWDGDGEVVADCVWEVGGGEVVVWEVGGGEVVADCG